MFGFFQPVKFNSDGSIKKEAAKKAPEKKQKVAKSKKRTRLMEKRVKDYLYEVSSILTILLSEVEKSLTDVEKRRIISALNKAIKRLT